MKNAFHHRTEINIKFYNSIYKNNNRKLCCNQSDDRNDADAAKGMKYER